MGKLENEVKIRTRNAKVSKVILSTLVIAVAGMLNPTALVSGVLRKLKTGKNKRRLVQNSVYAARRRLLMRGMIEYREGFLCITESGKALLQRMEFDEYKTLKLRRWDKKWRLLIFDIKEDKKFLREKVRRTLSSIGFKHLQDSVWVYPYDCEDFISLLKVDFRVGKEALYVIADTIENDVWLKKEFGLQ